MIKAFLGFYRKLRHREKVLLIVFIVVISFSLYFKIVYKPLTEGVNDYRLKAQRLTNNLNELRAKLPELKDKKKEIEILENERDQLVKQIDKMQNSLPAKENVTEILGEFSRQANGIKLLSLQQEIKPDKGYPKLYIEVKFEAPYEEMIAYIRKMQTISSFIKIEEAEFSKVASANTEISGKMVFSSFLSKVPAKQSFKVKKIRESLPKVRNIFSQSTKKQVLKERIGNLKLEGITFSMNDSSAIINGEIVRINTQIDSFTVKRILPDSVVLADGQQDFSLVIQK